jgi:predicted enzyme related to lactoylglutathione lyase
LAQIEMSFTGKRPGMSVAFTVPSLEKAISDLSAKGVRFQHRAPKSGPVGRYVAFVDPFGTVFEPMER